MRVRPKLGYKHAAHREDHNFLAEVIREGRVGSLFIGQNGPRTCYKAIAECQRAGGVKECRQGTTTPASKDRTVTLRITESKTREMYSTTKGFTEEETGQRRLRTNKEDQR